MRVRPGRGAGICVVETGKNVRLLLIVSFLTVSLFAISNLPWTLGDYDQAKQAFVSFSLRFLPAPIRACE